MITVNEWCAGGKGGGVSVQSVGEMGKDFCPNFLQQFLENIDSRSCNDGSRELAPIFHNPLLRRWLAPWSTLKGCPLRPRRAGERKTSSDQYPKGPRIS